MTATSDYYGEYWTETGYNPGSEIDADLQQAYERHLRGRVLDIGCGDGNKTGKWARDNDCQYTGVDISATAVERARHAGYEAQEIESAEQMPFTDQSFDSAVCIEVLEHLFSPHLTVQEARRVLKPGGVLIVTVPNAGHIRDRIDMLFGQWHPRGDSLGRAEPWRSPHIRFFHPKSLRRMVQAAGFTDVTIHGTVGQPLLGYVPAARRFVHDNGPSRAYVSLGRNWPSLWAGGLTLIAR